MKNPKISPINCARQFVSAKLFAAAFVFGFVALGSAATVKAGNTWTVDSNYSSSGCNGDNLRCQNLKDAVNAASSGDKIKIVAGRWDGQNDILIENKDLMIEGAGVPQVRPHPNGGTFIDLTTGTMITGYEICSNCSTLQALGRVFNIRNSTVAISNLQITGGNSKGGRGGAIYKESGSLTLFNTHLIGESSGGDGGVIYNGTGTLSLTNSYLQGSSGGYLSGSNSGNGGGIYNVGTLSITNTTISTNVGASEGRDNGSGGGLYNNGGTVTIAKTLFTNCSIGMASSGTRPGTTPNRTGFAAGNGGAIYNNATGTITVTNSEFVGNSAGHGGSGGTGSAGGIGSGYAGAVGGSGGAIYNSGTMKISDSGIIENKGGKAGKGGNSITSASGGSSGGSGGGIYNDGTMLLENTSVLNNKAGEGSAGGDGLEVSRGGNGGNGGSGGGISSGKNLKMVNVTVFGNSTGERGYGGASSGIGSASPGRGGSVGGVLANSVDEDNPNAKNTIIAGNTFSFGGSLPDVGGHFDSDGNNLIGAGYDYSNFNKTGDQVGTESEKLDPKLEKQSWEGRIGYFFVPKEDSPAYNAGGDAVSNITGAALKNDQRGAGMTRKYNGIVDIGAIERQPPNTAPTAKCKNITVQAESYCLFNSLKTSDVDNGSYDVDGNDFITLSFNSTAPLELGLHKVVLVVEDDRGLTSSCTSEVTVVDEIAPAITAPTERTFKTGTASTVGGVTLTDLDTLLGTATATDNCSIASLVRTGTPANNFFPVGTTTLTYTATDTKGQTTAATQKVVVIDDTAPTITAPAAKTFYTGAGANAAGVVINNLDASLGTPTVFDNHGVASTVRSGVPANNFFPTGTTTLTYTVTDKSGNQTTATQIVTVVDNTPPTISGAAVNPSIILQPNGRMVDVAVSYNTGDNSGGAVVTNLTVTSSEPTGAGDMVVVNNRQVRLKAARLGSGSGRVYTIVITATDVFGNSFSQSVTVTVRHDQRN